MRIAAVTLMVLVPAAAAAHGIEIDPSEPRAPATGPAAPNPYIPPPGAVALPPSGQATGQAGSQTIYIVPPGDPNAKPKEPEPMDLGESGPSGAAEGQGFEGQTPEVHVVQKGDTLWSICAYYFGDSWKWPEIWGLNPA